MPNKTLLILGSLFTLLLIVLSYLYFDIPVGRWAIAQDGSILDDIATFLGYFGEALYILIISGLIWIITKYIKTEHTLLMVRSRFVFLSVVITGIGANVIKVIFGKARPILLKNQDEFGFTWFASLRDHAHLSFPSGHATTAFTLATALTLFFPRAWPLFYSYAVTIALARVGAWDHYPSDVMAGALFGTLTTLLLYHSKFMGLKKV